MNTEYSDEDVQFDPKQLPETPTPIYDVDGRHIGTFNPYTQVIHPTSDSPFGAMKILGTMAFDMHGVMVGNFTAMGHFRSMKKKIEIK
jgi:hypothetical protein